jgi:hypothetical protein
MLNCFNQLIMQVIFLYVLALITSLIVIFFNSASYIFLFYFINQ